MENESYSKIKLNSLVKVRLNETGISILKSCHDYHRSMISSPLYYEKMGDFELVIDKDGYTELKLWEIFYYFGNYCFYEGTQEDERCLPFEPNIIINNENIILIENKSLKKGKKKKSY